ncbi:MAG: ABC transporter permease subunit [Ruminococcaceae bacterium]|nr:ABC transporter permease subunit [Oscillospiraceae bacterium]
MAKTKKKAANALAHTFLAVICIVWLLPLAWVVLHSFRQEPGPYTETFLPQNYTLDNYKVLFTDKSIMDFPRMFFNTFVVACFTCAVSTFFVLSVAYCTSRLRFKFRKPFMNLAMVVTLFPGFMSMVAVYFILKALGLTEGAMIPVALVICFSAGAGAGFYMMKGYMDTIPKALDEAAYLDGATRWQTYTRITLPLCKPMIVYQIITSFMVPWVDFVVARLITGANSKYFTVSIGLWNMLEKEYAFRWFTRFCAGAVLVSIPIAILFMYTQRFYQEAMSGSVKG